MVVLSVIVILMLNNEKKLLECQKIKYNSFLIGAELRRSSEELTQYCRMYVITGDSTWETKYWNVLQIRNGEYPRSNGRRIALRDSMVLLGITKQELNLLNTSEKLSNELVGTEKIAFNAMKGYFADSLGIFSIQKEPDKKFAQKIMFDNHYFLAKQQIMEPIDKFIETFEERNRNLVDSYIRRGYTLLILSISFLTAVIFISIIAFHLIRKKLEEQIKTLMALKDSEDRHRTILRTALDGFWMVDLQGRILEVNESFCKMSGYTNQELLTMKISELEVIETEDEIISKIQDILIHGNAQFEAQHRRKNGSIYHVEVNAQYQPINDGLIVAFIHDISNRKLAENNILELNANLELRIAERTSQLVETNLNLQKEIEDRRLIENALSESEKSYRTVVENVREVVFKIDANGLWLYLNNSWEEITGFTVGESIGKLFLDYVYPEDRQLCRELFEPMIKREEEFCLHEIRYITKDGGFRWIEVFARLGLNELDEVIGAYGTLYDITERKNAEQAIKLASAAAKEANLAKSEFLSRMSHELRTPLNSILGFAQLIEMDNPNEQKKKGLHHIITSGKHLLDLINEILDISRLEAGKMSINLEPLPINGIIPEIIEIIEPIAKLRQITIIQELSATNGHFVNSDSKLIRQVILNLLNNAVKYNKEAGTISITSKIMTQFESEFNFVRILISDTGIGISPENITKLFTPFERVGAEKLQIEGTGLGLAVVKKIIEVLGGNVGVESILGEGSVFWIDIPEKRNPEKRNENELEQNHELLPKNNTGTILYIEDNSSNFELIHQILISYRPNIRLFNSITGFNAVELTKDLKPDLILLDLNLPDISGYEVVRNLRLNSETNSTPIIVLTADIAIRQYENLLKESVLEYMTKPLDIPKFLLEVDKVLKES